MNGGILMGMGDELGLVKEGYLADLRSPFVQVVDTATDKVIRKVGPFGSFVRPFTVNRALTRGCMCVNDLLGFEVKKDDGKQCYMICGDSSIGPVTPSRPLEKTP